jgi:hypothetical protein
MHHSHLSLSLSTPLLTLNLSIMSAISFLPLDLARSAGVWKGYQNEQQKHSHILSFEMSHPNTTDKFIVPLHHTLSHQKDHPSLPLPLSLIFMMILQTKDKKRMSERISILCPKRIDEIRKVMNTKWKIKYKTTIINGNQISKIHNTIKYLILR